MKLTQTVITRLAHGFIRPSRATIRGSFVRPKDTKIGPMKAKRLGTPTRSLKIQYPSIRTKGRNCQRI